MRFYGGYVLDYFLVNSSDFLDSRQCIKQEM